MVSKYLTKIGRVKPKPKPKPKPRPKLIPRYRKDAKTGETFLNRRATLAGLRGIKKKPGTYKSGLKEGMITGAMVGAAGTYMAGKSKTAKDAKAKVKKAAEEHIKKNKKKKYKDRGGKGNR